MSPPDEIPQTPRAKTRIDNDKLDVMDGHLSGGNGPGKLLSQETATQKAGPSFLDPDAFRRLSSSPFSERGRLSPVYLLHHPSSGALPGGGGGGDPSFKASCARFWRKHQPVIFVFAAQFFGALMNLSARLLELDGKGMHPLQLLFVRMSLTTTVSCLYMYWKKTPHFPLGAKEVRRLLVARGLSGFFGIFGMWYSLQYLPLAEATVIGFLVPSAAAWLSHITIHDPFTRKEQIGSLLCLAGVVLIARPTSLFASATPDAAGAASSPVDGVGVTGVAGHNMTRAQHPSLGGDVTPSQRLSALGVALLGVLGGAGAFTTIRAIGTRAHPLISVTYFSTWCTIVSTTVLGLAPLLNVGQPALQFELPESLQQWALLMFISVCGFLTQFLMTSGLGSERSNRAAAMTYTQMLFAAGFDKWVFGHEMGAVSLFGCALIVGSALWVALSKKPAAERPAADVEVGQIVGAETLPMLAIDLGDDDDDESDGVVGGY